MATKYLKSVRTRYRNTLTRENENAGRLIYEIRLTLDEESEIDKDSCIEKLERCMEKIQQYREKLENQSEKLATALSEKEPDVSDEVVAEHSDCVNSRWIDIST